MDCPLVMVVDDDDGVRQFVTDALVISGFRVLAASDAPHALKLVNHSLDLVLTDVVMPGMDGVDLAAELAKLLPETPVVLMSGYTSAPERLEKSGRPCIAKPFKIESLVAMLRSALRAPRPHVLVGT